MPDIFLSYNREDQAKARWFAEAFGAEGLDVWWDVTLRSGEAYDEVTENALRTAKAVVVLWSARSVASRWVRAEATLADRNKTLIPVMIEPCERPIMFELTQTADLAHWSGAPDDSAWRALLADVRRFVEKEAVAPADTPRSPAQPRPPRADRRGGAPSLAILPFVNRSGLAEDDVFAFGMVEDIIDAMSQGVEVRVVASSATARFRTGEMPDLDAMARQLGVRYVLEGNVRRAGENLRVTTQLIEAAGGNILWTQKFDRPLDQLAALQEELVLEVAAHLRTQAHRLEIERALRKPGDLTAWEAVMRSIAAYRRMTGPALLLGLEEARKAVEIAPDYGLAHALFAQAQAIIYNQMAPDSPAEAQRIRAQIEHALTLDPDNPLVLSTAAGGLAALGFPEEGLAAGRRAIQLNPSNEFGHFACGMASSLLNRCDEAIAYFDRELRLAPDNPTIWISYGWRANSHIRAGRWAEGAQAYDDALRLTPDNAAPNFGKAVCCRVLGRDEEARQFFALGRKYEPDTPLAIWELRFRRTNAGGPMEEEFIGHLKALWAESEPG
ncbi:MAG: TIR domain-containing protein [Caulobacterales bacterium]